MTKQMPGWMLRDHANLADAYKQHIHDGGESALGDFLRDEAARREAEAQPDAPPPPAPDSLTIALDANIKLRARAEAAEAEAKRLRDVLKEARTYVELTADHECGSEEGTAARQLLAAIDNAFAKGGKHDE